MQSSRHSQHFSKFTLVEIVLAILVVAAGIIAVMTLMPIGMTKNKESIGARSAADVGDQFLHAVAADANVNWDTLKALPDALPSMPEDQIVWSEQSILPDATAEIHFSAANVSDNFDPAAHQDGVFKAVQMTQANVVDFVAVIRAWKEVETIESKSEGYVNKRMGDIVPLGIVDASNGTDTENYGLTPGQDYVLKQSGGNKLSPGNYGALALGGNGAANFESNIINGYNNLSVGDSVPPETGNMAGPTITGINARLPHSPYVRIAVVSPFAQGKKNVTIVAFLAFKLQKCVGSGNTGATVHATFIGASSSGNGDGDNSDSLTGAPSYKVTLKAEVSWPESLPYHQREKEIYSLKLFKGGNVGLRSND